MNKYKVCVYAISKNEEKFAKRWIDSMKEADAIYVLDTGSSDNTVNILKNNNAIVETKIINPWRFDVARNEALKLIPDDYDICVCTDLDEVFIPGWRKKLESIWNEDTTRLLYNYNWKLDINNNPLVNFYIDKIHSRNDYKWCHPVHEVLEYIGNKNEFKISTDEITLNHYPDENKSRKSYLPLLELSVKEDPFDDRNMHYLGREYMYYGMWNESIDTLIKHLSLKKSTWKDERCASMRFIARCYDNLNRYEEANMWLDKAIKEANYLREPYMEMAIFKYKNKYYNECLKYCKMALKISKQPKSYISEFFSKDSYIYDMMSICFYNIGKYSDSLKYANLALKLDKNNSRIKNNIELIKNKLLL
ncbi:MAG: glycosyltransferase [Firmicutes bacterium]|nr:glycosyltransferase [Bacillota bacterium]